MQNKANGMNTADDCTKFEVVLEAELAAIADRRKTHTNNGDVDKQRLVGLALSGGGIRSATFSLGILQALDKLHLLHIFDYLSTVSGGGYTGGWWSAWLSRAENIDKGLFPSDERIAFERSDYFGTSTDGAPDGAASAGIDPIHHLRLFSNYLTPKKGLLSADTWRAVAVVSRNLLLTWMILIPMLIAAILIGQMYFAFQPEATTEFLFPKGKTRYANEFLADSATQATLRADYLQDSAARACYADSAKLQNACLPMYQAKLDSLKHSIHRDSLHTANAFYLSRRIEFSLWPLIALVGWIAMLTTAWMQCVRDNGRKKRLRIAFGAPFAGLALTAFLVWKCCEGQYKISNVMNVLGVQAVQIFLVVWVAIAVGILYSIFKLPKKNKSGIYDEGYDRDLENSWRLETLRNNIVNHHARLLTIFAALFVVLGIAGFGRSMYDWLFSELGPTGSLGAYIAKSGGILAVLISLVTSVYAAFSAAPSGGADKQKPKNSKMMSILMIVAPTLLVFTILIASAWFTTRYLPVFDRLLCVPLWLVILLLIFLMVGLVVAIGYAIDPNAISLHTFYKARLIRAYLGASNAYRRIKKKDITVAVAGDDVCLKDLDQNSKGPYHLIQTTLNLVSASDLGIAQRHAESFVMAKNHCGSLRTGYRSTDGYMGGKLTLGTAVSVSGAAASPNMGSKTPNGALVVLMSLFNIRLGYWAPNPDRNKWWKHQAGFWPYYMLRELLSQTNELSSYCYLTDGGHFDNTGLYPLIERGVRYIVIADNGADPNATFSDLGNAIRRCRIDFGVEFDLDIAPLFPVASNDQSDGDAAQHFVVGKIIYSKAHADLLGWKDCDSDDSRTGIVVVIKPEMTATEKVDVRQYKLENSEFPNQTTAQQWYDEAEFESYRKLGERSLLAAFKDELGQSLAIGRPFTNEIFEWLSKQYYRSTS